MNEHKAEIYFFENSKSIAYDLTEILKIGFEIFARTLFLSSRGTRNIDCKKS